VRLYDAVMNILVKHEGIALDDVMDRHRLAEALVTELRTGPWRAVKAEDRVPKKRGFFRVPKLLKRKR